VRNRIVRHPGSGEEILLAPNRRQRPNALLTEPSTDARCPFCPGNEEMTPPEIERVGNESSWEIRVVPNKYPVASSAREGIRGRHEVIIESCDHDAELRTMPLDHVRRLVATWIRRWDAAAALEETRYVSLFRNRGRNAGESIAHTHSQLLAIPVVPPRLLEHSSRIARSLSAGEPCPLCDSVLSLPSLILRDTTRFRLMAGPAARLPHTLWIVPFDHAKDFRTLDDEGRGELAEMLRFAESLLIAELGDVSINWIFLNGLLRTEPDEFHWYVEVIPRLASLAGFELGSGLFINVVPPQDAAVALQVHLEKVEQELLRST
jgi:UDPglucose--hexose-1-phosphate uridylyltransferase